MTDTRQLEALCVEIGFVRGLSMAIDAAKRSGAPAIAEHLREILLSHSTHRLANLTIEQRQEEETCG